MNTILPYSLHYESQNAVWQLSSLFLEHIPFHHERLVFCCIGSDRCTGDTLGPLTGSFLKRAVRFPYEIIGSLEEPLHALNLNDTVQKLHNDTIKPFIIAIDACLGSEHNIGHIAVQDGPILPGKAVKKQLPPIGDISVKGIVNIGGFMEMLVLQNTRLHISYAMAEKLSRALILAIHRYTLKNVEKGNHHTDNNDSRQQVSSFDFR
ncbi:spore protease YyaC [Lysinibacillus piscis]|uniref:Spore protease YyaC n=1 Tax=Lysinibacillus piscis TaxID=2518931 RepID=A0ABQ5NQ28_9BACI|nr:spore protease YyaC [Lysinibacillus sp. KH24]GLC90109.1 spore protease YyaC [Lysinibacillus sp. KH24]